MPIPIVAIASSAGGLEALLELLPALPTNSELAFVVIQHLDRDHNSLLTELLAKRSPVPVTTITDGLEVQSAHMYVIGPNISVTLVDNHFVLTKRPSSKTPHHPADVFFESLARGRREPSIAVVLSGGDSDGTYGVQVIKQAGGITFAQTPATAKCPSMPQRAINTACVDYVLDPLEIGRELARLARHPILRSATEAEDADTSLEHDVVDWEGELRQIFRLLYTAHRVDFQYYKRSTLQRRLVRRMALRDVATIDSYLALLEEEPAELSALYRDFLILVTSFFRDPETFEFLRATVFPAISDGKGPGESIRVWVPGCATGEEVYSIAILLMEYINDRQLSIPIQIFGTDLNEASIDQARLGVYIDTIDQVISAERLQRYFIKSKGHYQIDKSIREMCIFARHDVTQDPPFSRLDLVSCRNLLIYLDTAAQRRVMRIFHYALRSNAFLMLGPSESVGYGTTLFDLVDKSHKLFAKKNISISHDFNFATRTPGAALRTTPWVAQAVDVPTDAEAIAREADRILLSRFAPASVLVNNTLNIVQFRGDTSSYLIHSSGAASFDLHRVVRPELLVHIIPALQDARNSGDVTLRRDLRTGSLDEVSVEITPIKTLNGEHGFLLVFYPDSSNVEAPPLPAPKLSESESRRRVVQLERELEATREYLKSTIDRHDAIRENLQSVHEEVLSANEELQSTNEELETAKEELQSANEELSTTNDELRSRNRDLSAVTTAAQLARQAAVRAQQYAEAIIESVRDPLIVLDAELKVLRVNHSFCSYFQLSKELVEDRPLRLIGDGKWNKDELNRSLAMIANDGGALNRYRLSYVLAPTAQPRLLLINARKIPGDADRSNLVLLAVEDVTDRALSDSDPALSV